MSHRTVSAGCAIGRGFGDSKLGLFIMSLFAINPVSSSETNKPKAESVSLTLFDVGMP